MFFIIFSHGIFSFLLGKIFIFFPKETSLLFQISEETLIKSISFFNLGFLIGKISIIKNLINKNNIYFYYFFLILLNLINYFSFKKTTLYFFLIRFFTGLILGLLLNFFLKITSTNSKKNYLYIIFNYHLIGIPIWIIFRNFITIKYWLLTISIFLFINCIYIYLNSKNFNEKKQKENFSWINSYENIFFFFKIFLFFNLLIVSILFISTLVLISHQYGQSFFLKDKIFLFLKKYLNHIEIFYDQIPLLIGGIFFFLKKKIKILYLICFIKISLILNFFFFKNLTFFSIINGLIYSLYIIYAPYLGDLFKSLFKKNSIYGSLFIYGSKSFFSFLLQFFFLKKCFNFIKISFFNYFIFTFIFIFCIFIFYIIKKIFFLKLKNNSISVTY